MYWPIGPPKAYEQRIPANLTLTSTDLVDTAVTGAGKDEETNGGVRTSKANDHDNTPSTPETKRTVNGSHRRRKSQAESIDPDDGSILDLGVSKAGHIFATITRTTLTVWQTKPAVIITSLVRTLKSLKSYGNNVGLLLRPDADIIVIQSAHGYLITYSLLLELGPRVYQLHLTDGSRSTRRRNSTHTTPTRYGPKSRGLLAEGGAHVQEARLHFRMVIRLDAGISKALALDNELLVITKEPGAVQCVRWAPDRAGAQFSTQMLGDMPWLDGDKAVTDVVYDKPMNLFAFLSHTGRAYAVQRLSDASRAGKNPDALFDGHIFHTPTEVTDVAFKAAINARFSLIALGCTDGSIYLYNVQNYAGGIRLLKRLPLPAFALSAGQMTSLSYSPDGYCLFVGYETGWLTWSVYGQVGGSSFGGDVAQSQQNGDDWLSGVTVSCWIGAGSDALMLAPNSDLIWSQEFARSAVTGCYNPANVSKALLQTSMGLIVYQGDQLTDLETITSDASVWQHLQVPAHYLADQWPLRAAVISPDRRYIAIAGQRGLAHYSLASGRWRTFQNSEEQDDFTVRGGMCWHHHVLIAAIETSYEAHELRLYSRELPLENSRVLYSIGLSSPVVTISTTGDDGILVYQYDNTLDHYIVDSNDKSIQLIKVGQITLSGVIRAPARVRAVSWIVPDLQLQQGEASQDVTSASVLFLIDGKLVLLQPSLDDKGDLKYDLRVIASNIEYFTLARDDPAVYAAIVLGDYDVNDKLAENILRDSLWAFDGHHVKVWPDIQELLGQDGHELDTSIDISVDFYPFSAPLQKGLIVGAEAELTQRRDVNFSYFRTVARTTLFLPSILRYYLTHYDVTSALRLSAPFKHLPYFSHALEILLHTILDEEVERPTTNPSTPMHSRTNTATATNGLGDCLTAAPTPIPSFLPTVLDFLSNFPDNLDIILQCTRKTELRSWRTLFAHLPPPVHLFEQALTAGDLKTAGGYLLVLQQHLSDVEEIADDAASESDTNGIANDMNGTNISTFLPMSTTPNSARPISTDNRESSCPRPFSISSRSDQDTAVRSAQVVPQATSLLRRAQQAQEWDLCKELARFLMALDESGDTLRSALEAVKAGGLHDEKEEGVFT